MMFRRVLIWVWELLDQSCGKRVVASLRWRVSRRGAQGELGVEKRAPP